METNLLEKLSHYLAYDLKIVIEKDLIHPYMDQPICKKGDVVKFSAWSVLIMQERADFAFKPVLFPFDSISKQDWKQIILNVIDNDIKNSITNINYDIHVKGSVIRFYDKDEGFRFILPKKNLFTILTEPNLLVNTIYRFDIKRLLSELYEKHIDIYGLIDQDIAINGNNLNINPYESK